MGLGRTGCATPPTTLTPPRRMTTSAVCGDAQLLHGREDHQRRHLYEHRRVQLQAGENNKERWLRSERGVCTRTPKQDCYNIPRKIQVEVCKTDVHRYCEKFSNIFPFPVEKQNCHFEPKKICELEM